MMRPDRRKEGSAVHKYFEINGQGHNIRCKLYYQGSGAAKRTVIFCASRKHAELIAAGLQDRGIPAMAVDGSMKLAEYCLSELGWKKSTAFTMLRKMSAKGFIKNENSTVTSPSILNFL